MHRPLATSCAALLLLLPAQITCQQKPARTTAASTSPKKDEMTLRSIDRYKWKDRLLLIAAPSEDSPGLREFNKKLTTQAEQAKERDIVTLRIVNDQGSASTGAQMSQELVQQLRRRFDLGANQTKLILIGKDGGEKRSQTGDGIDLGKLWALIDTMPMRRREMRERASEDAR